MINPFNKKNKIELSIDLFLKESNLLYKNVAKEILLAYSQGEMKKAYLLSKEIEENCDFISEIIDPYNKFYFENFKKALKEYKKEENINEYEQLH